jgi:hypothetical protein
MASNLQAKYIAHFISRTGTMSITDANEYLTWLRDNPTAEFRDTRISELSRYIFAHNQREAASTELKRRQLEAAHESRDLSEKWERLGASWRALGSLYTIWEYGGVEFYRWESGVEVLDEIPRAKEAGIRLQKIISEREAN